MKISQKLCIRMDGTQCLWLWWFTAKNHSPQTYQPAVYVLTFIIENKVINVSNFTIKSVSLTAFSTERDV